MFPATPIPEKLEYNKGYQAIMEKVKVKTLICFK